MACWKGRQILALTDVLLGIERYACMAERVGCDRQ
jgi:hypothetical protein